MAGFLTCQKEPTTMAKGQRKYSPELKERAVRLKLEQPERSFKDVAADLGVHHEALRLWVRQAQADRGIRRDQLSTPERDELKQLRAENARLKKANQVLKDASVFFATELDSTRRR